MHTQFAATNAGLKAPPPPTTTERMTDFMREHVALDRSVTVDDLVRAGFEQDDVVNLGPAAALAANKQFVRQLSVASKSGDRFCGSATRKLTDDPTPQPVRSPQQGANLIKGLMPKITDVHLALRSNGWSNADIAQSLTNILAIAGDDFATLVPA